jgi:hypothetical protein
MLASGLTIAYDDSMVWSMNNVITNTDRHFSIISNVAQTATCFNMRNLTTTNGWDMIVEGDGNNRFAWQSAPISGEAGTTWMTLDSVNGNLTLYNDNDANNKESASLYTLGGIYCTKNITSSELTVTTSVDSAVTCNVINTNAGTNALSQIEFVNDGDNTASLFFNSSLRTADGGANTLTLRNNAGKVRVQSNGGLGLTLEETTGDIVLDGTLTVSSTTDSSSSTDGGSATIGGGLAVAKSTYIGGNLIVTGTVTVADAVTNPTVSTLVADMVNITSLAIKNATMVIVNNQNMLNISFKVTPTAGSLNTQFTFNLPGRNTLLVESLDMDIGQCSGFTDPTNLIVLQNVLCTGVPDSTKAVVKFQSISTNVHYLQVFVSYNAI